MILLTSWLYNYRRQEKELSKKQKQLQAFCMLLLQYYENNT
jgi:hypothetical protein